MDTKLDIIQGMYSQLRISGLTVQPTPEDVGLAIIRLEDMMDEFFGRGLCIGYNFEETPTVTSPHGLARQYRHMAQTNLAIRVIPDFNKSVPQELQLQAKQSYSSAYGTVALETLRQVQAPRRMPRGTGNTLRYNRWQRFNRPEHLPDNKCSSTTMVKGDIDDFTESFEDYLEGDTITSFVIAATKSLDVVSSSNSDNIVSYRLKALDPVTSGAGQSVVITITTNNGRVTTRSIGFIVLSSDA